ncbi:MAG: YheC/YheD family protein [Bacillota bacterium]
MQQFIPADQIDQNNYDIRLYVQKGGTGKWTISGGFCRISYINCYISNYCLQPGSIDYILAANSRFSKKQRRELVPITQLSTADAALAYSPQE